MGGCRAGIIAEGTIRRQRRMNSTGKKIAAFAVGAAISAALFYARMWLRRRPRKIETRLA